MSRIRANKITDKAGTGAIEIEKGAWFPVGYGLTGAGGINLTGVITATSFVGSGANLTGIDATAVKDSGGNVKIQAQASGAVYTGIHTFSGQITASDHINLASSKKLSMASDVFKIYHSTNAAIINESGDLLINQNVSNKNIIISTGSGPTESVRITADGRILKGTTSSVYDVDIVSTERTVEIGVENNSSVYRTALNTTNNVNADFNIQHKTNLTSIGTGVNIPLCFHINGGTNAVSAEKMRLDTSGDLNIEGGNINSGANFPLNFLDSISNYIGVAADGGSNNGDALFIAHSHGSGLAIFGYEAGGDRLVIGTDAGNGQNKIDFLNDVGGTSGGSTDNLNGKVPKMRINPDGKISIGTVETSTGLLLLDKDLTAESDVSDKNNYHLVIRSQTNSNTSKIGIAFANTTDDTHVGAAILHHRTSTDSIGDLAFYTSPSSGTTTERFRIDKDGKLYKSGNQFYPLVNYVEVTTFSGVNVSSSSYTDLRTVYSNYSPKKAGNRIVIHHQSQMWNGASGQGSGDCYWRIMKDEGSGYSAFVTNERILGNHDGWNNSGGYSGLARHHRTVHLMGSFICNGNNFNLKTQGRSIGVGWDWYHDSNNILQIWEYELN